MMKEDENEKKLYYLIMIKKLLIYLQTLRKKNFK